LDAATLIFRRHYIQRYTLSVPDSYGAEELPRQAYFDASQIISPPTLRHD